MMLVEYAPRVSPHHGNTDRKSSIAGGGRNLLQTRFPRPFTKEADICTFNGLVLIKLVKGATKTVRCPFDLQVRSDGQHMVQGAQLSY
ncbi:hypothetical protein D3C71_1240450 [compost metagenome]